MASDKDNNLKKEKRCAIVLYSSFYRHAACLHRKFENKVVVTFPNPRPFSPLLNYVFLLCCEELLA